MTTRIIIRKYGAIVAGVLFPFLFVLGIVHILNSFFEFTTIEIVGSQIAVEINKDRLSSNLLFISSKELKDEIQVNNKYIKSISIRKKYPHTLTINIEGRFPFAVLQADNGIKVLIDYEGYVIGPETEPSFYPVLFFDIQLPTVGNQVTDERVQQALSFLKQFGIRSGISNITSLDKLSLKAKLNKTDILFPQSGNLVSQISSLQTILLRFRMKGTVPNIIDLRFSKPLIRE